MKQSTYSVTILEPTDGHTLTQSGEVEIQERILSKKVFLAVNDHPSNWKEITDAEAEEIRKEREAFEQATAKGYTLSNG